MSPVILATIMAQLYTEESRLRYPELSQVEKSPSIVSKIGILECFVD
jgi:hypothetical protein